jgi:hypothetical protein
MKIAIMHSENPPGPRPGIYFPYKFMLTGENISDGIDLGKTIGFFDSLNIKYEFDREQNTLIFRTNFDRLEL